MNNETLIQVPFPNGWWAIIDTATDKLVSHTKFKRDNLPVYELG